MQADCLQRKAKDEEDVEEELEETTTKKAKKGMTNTSDFRLHTHHQIEKARAPPQTPKSKKVRSYKLKELKAQAGSIFPDSASAAASVRRNCDRLLADKTGLGTPFMQVYCRANTRAHVSSCPADYKGDIVAERQHQIMQSLSDPVVSLLSLPREAQQAGRTALLDQMHRTLEVSALSLTDAALFQCGLCASGGTCLAV